MNNYNQYKSKISTVLIGILFSLLFCLTLPAENTWNVLPKKININENLSFVFLHDTSSEISIVKIFINGGKRAEPIEQRGLAFLTTRLCTEFDTSKKIRNMIKMGSSISVSVEGDFSTIRIKCLSENLEKTLKIILKSLSSPLFSSIRISNIKNYMKNIQKNSEDQPQQVLMQESYNTFFGKAGYSGSGMGTQKTLKKIKKKHIKAFYNNYINLSNMVIIVSSNLNDSKIKNIVESQFSILPIGQKQENLPKIEIIKPLKKELRFNKNTKQSLVGVSALLPEMTTHNYTCGYLLQIMLGNGIGSRLWPLRADKKLAYILNGIYMQMKKAGLLTVYLKTDKSKTEKAINALEKVIDTLLNEGLTEAEFATVQTGAFALFLRQNETKIKAVSNLGFFVILGQNDNFVANFHKHIYKLKLSEFINYIKKALDPENRIKIVIGPEK